MWNPNHNAAYIYNNSGQAAACVASADVAKARSREEEVKIDVGDVLGKIGSVKAEDKLKIVETLTKLGSPSNASAFLNVALFHICLMAGAGKISGGDMKPLLEKAMDTAAGLNSGG
ncbi:hypothetical protein D3C87_1722170 [compost metagenome]